MNKFSQFFSTHGVEAIAPVQQSQDSIWAAYAQGIALPEVSVCDRRQEVAPVVIDESGKELTWERRQAMWAERNQLMASKGLDPTKNLRDGWEELGLLPPEERYGMAAVTYRPGIRKTPTYRDEDLKPRLLAPPPQVWGKVGPNGVTTPGLVASPGDLALDAYTAEAYLEGLVYAYRDAVGLTPTIARMSTRAKFALHEYCGRWLDHAIAGCRIELDDHRHDIIKIEAEPNPRLEVQPFCLARIKLLGS